jgi:hypothetical protein
LRTRRWCEPAREPRCRRGVAPAPSLNSPRHRCSPRRHRWLPPPRRQQALSDPSDASTAFRRPDRTAFVNSWSSRSFWSAYRCEKPVIDLSNASLSPRYQAMATGSPELARARASVHPQVRVEREPDRSHQLGRIAAGFIMSIGRLTLAVITAQVASSFVTQGPSRAQRGPPTGPATPEVTLAEFDRRLARIEELRTAITAPSRASGGNARAISRRRVVLTSSRSRIAPGQIRELLSRTPSFTFRRQAGPSALPPGSRHRARHARELHLGRRGPVSGRRRHYHLQL